MFGFFTPEMLGALVRTALQVAGTWVVARGWGSEADVATVSAALGVIGVTGYGMYVRRATGLVQSAANVEAVKEIVVDRPVAKEITGSVSAKVISSN